MESTFVEVSGSSLAEVEGTDCYQLLTETGMVSLPKCRSMRLLQQQHTDRTVLQGHPLH